MFARPSIAGFLGLPLVLFPPVASPLAPQEANPERALSDEELEPLAEAVGAHRAARAKGSGLDAALEAVHAERMELSKQLGGRDLLGRPADFGRAVWLSWERNEMRRGRGKVITGTHREGTFAVGGMDYAFRVPDDYEVDRAWPLILSIPDEGEEPAAHLRERWTDRELLERAILFAPAMPTERAEWDQVMVEGRPGGLAHLLTAERLASEWLAVDPDRVYVVGLGKGVPAAVGAGNYSPHRFAGIVGRAGDASELGPENFRNLPTLFAGGGAKARAFAERAGELGFDNSEVEPAAKEADIWAWMQAHPRDAHPAQVSIVVGKPFPTRVHWLRVAPTAMDTNATAVIDREANRIDITCSGTSSVALFLSDALVDLGSVVTIVCNGEATEVSLRRSLAETLGMFEEGLSDAGTPYTAQHVIELNAPEALDAVATEALELGDSRKPTAEQGRRLADGWVRQDLAWIPPDEAEQVEQGLWRVDGEWLELASANRRRGGIHSMWRIPSRQLLVHSTASRAVALRAMSEMQSALADLKLVFGAEPDYPLSVAVMRDEEQYDRLAFGDPDGRRPPTHVERLHIIHSAFYAESWYEPVNGDLEFNGMGVCYWDTFAPYGDRYGRHGARLAVGLSYAAALDPSPKAARSARREGPPPGYYEAFHDERVMPAWLHYGGAVYAERYFEDTTVGPDGDKWWAREWSLENLQQKGGLRPLEEIFAFPADPDERDDGLRLYIECGLLVSFMLHGDCAPVVEEHEKLKRTLERGRLHPRTIKDLEEALIENEAALRAYAGL